MARAIVMPSLGMYTVEGVLVKWLKPTGASVTAGEPVAEIETEKVLADVAAPESGILHHVAEPGTTLQVESVLGYVLAPGEAAPEPTGPVAEPTTPAPVPQAATEAGPSPRPEIIASPNARRLAAELKVSLAGITGTGPGGRITEDDVRAAKGSGS